MAYALRLLASGQPMADVWREAGFASRKALADAIYRVADFMGTPLGEGAGAGSAEGRVLREPAQSVRRARRAGTGLDVVAYSDGASIGNPGPAGCGAVILDRSGEVLLEDWRYLGETTNNVAEYQGALLALTRARELGARRVELKVDSELVANQIKGGYRVKSPNLAGLFRDLKQIAGSFDAFEVTQVPRGENRQADKLANLAITSRRA